MYWYHWLASYMVIAGGIIFTIIPDKPWWLWLTIAALILGGLSFGLLPSKEDPYLKRALEREKREG